MAGFKKITKQAISGDRGIAFIHSVCARIGFAFHPSNQSIEAGIDGFIEIRDTESERATNCIIQVQSKAESGRFTAETDDSFEYLCNERDIDHWLTGNTPIILVASRPLSNEGYWVDVRAWFADPARRQQRRVTFSKAGNRFDENCKADLAALAVPKDAGFYFAPVPKTETLLSNLMPISSFAPHIYGASTKIRRPSEIWEWTRVNNQRLPDEWFLSGGRLHSIFDLRESPWPLLCERGTVERDDARDWSLSNDPESQRQYVRLLNLCLTAKLRSHGIRYHRASKRYYFLPPFGSLNTRSYSYRSLLKNTSRDVFRSYAKKKDPTQVSYYRHSAMRATFLRFDDEWYLEVNPTYFYTFDGKAISRFEGDLLAGVKRLEKNLAILGQLVMWVELLTKPPDLYNLDYPYLRFNDVLNFQVAFGLEDKSWLNRENLLQKESFESEQEFQELFK